MKKNQERPKTVPNEAVWNASQNEWELGIKNDQGNYIGEWKWWLAPKGHLCCHTFFDDKGRMLSFKRFHPNGEVSRYGTFENGVQIEDVYLKSSEPTSEVFAFGNSDEKVYKAVKRSGTPVSFDYYDKEGRHLNPPIIQKELISSKDSIIPESEIVTIKESIFEKGKSFLLEQFDKEFINETIIPILAKKTEEKTINVTDVGGIFMHLAQQAIETKKDIVFHDGDLHVSNLHCLEELEICVFIVHGNLTVDGSIFLSDDLMQLLFVTGNVSASNVSTSGMLFVFENLTVTNCILGDYNHGSAFVGGDLKAKFFFPEEYFFEVLGSANFTYAFGNSWRLNQNQSPEVFNYNEKKLSEFIPLLHDNIHEVASFTENTSLLDDNCSEGGLFEYIDYYEFKSYVIANKPVFKG
ncbi:hypothetical protein [Aquimarina algicola]|uniref:Uncharacterized protein n=1 Tax=Aquimarina algicola TaxID=2589995 RepID=A0A504J4T9_9FLAO|nr:hypothetical protein [Aquimarina algicola]TPN82918.1 hypothetical protein FHK87_21060 [Aquimarina algicola]